MEIRYGSRFARDVARTRNPDFRRRLEEVIEDLKRASSLTEVSNVRGIVGWEGHYRIRVGDYRLGIEMDGETVILRRAGHRREFNRYFP